MIKNELEGSRGNICDLSYLTALMNGEKEVMIEIIAVFLKEIPEALQSMNAAIVKTDFAALKIVAHTMKSSVAIMGISVLAPILQEMENLGEKANPTSIERIRELNEFLNLLCKKAMEEIEGEKLILKAG